MKTIVPHIEVIKQEPGIKGIHKQIERAGRTCYKSEANITDDSAEKFVERMIRSHHTAMLEHGTVYLMCPMSYYEIDWVSFEHRYKGNKYSKVYCESGAMYVTTNYRVLVENGWLDDLKYLCEPTEHHEKRITIKMWTDRGVTAEANRHRANSPAEQSTRYCNYSKDKFGNEITIALNADIGEEDVNEEYNSLTNQYGEEIFKGLCSEIVNDKDDIWTVVTTWLFTNLACEFGYMKLLNLGWTPQQARRVLPLDLHSELVHTAYESDWQHFIELRSIGTTGAPHPDMKIIGDMIKKYIK